ncbi:hypothetical protein [Affinirhizobium pseudoryzae]|uniref:hypothetical protein n=1 Tax=Allorhizobium pseudoryzae TaxID=379684 RepID=UPI0013EA8861|nr:hypothetical protein [Allorhizobium pseudoryzae]
MRVRQSRQCMVLYRIAVFISPGMMTAETCHAWEREGCKLIVHDDYPPIVDIIDHCAAGALLDIKLRASYLFDLSEMMTLKRVPHVFVVTDEAPGSHYSLNGTPEGIRSILDELLFQDDCGQRH